MFFLYIYFLCKYLYLTDGNQSEKQFILVDSAQNKMISGLTPGLTEGLFLQVLRFPPTV